MENENKTKKRREERINSRIVWLISLAITAPVATFGYYYNFVPSEERRNLVSQVINIADTNRDGKLDLAERIELYKGFGYKEDQLLPIAIFSKFNPDDSSLRGYLEKFGGQIKCPCVFL